MADFLVSLWESVFTPGTTPTLLVATNTSFAALQVVLFALLIATYSIHFIILSFLCGGLWWSINWFAHELQASKAQEENLKKKDDARLPDHDRDISATNRVGDVDDASETETEEATPASEDRRTSNNETTTTTSSRLRPEDSEDARKRRSTAGTSESEGYISTDSEWEKVEE